MACACLGCTNKRLYFVWLRDTVEEFGLKIPKSLQFDPWQTSNSRLDRAITNMLKLYQKGFLRVYGESSKAVQDDPDKEGLLLPFDVSRPKASSFH